MMFLLMIGPLKAKMVIGHTCVGYLCQKHFFIKEGKGSLASKTSLNEPLTVISAYHRDRLVL